MYNPPTPTPREAWGFPFTALAAMADPTDAGIGDTVHRKLGAGGALFKATLQTFGISCGCDARRDEWNVRYSYARYHMHLSATGLGDAVCGYYAACGLAESTGERVAYHAHSADWLTRAHHPLVYVLPQANVGANANADYAAQIAHAVTRKQDYCDRLATALSVPKFAPAMPKSIDSTGAAPAPRRVIIAPFCCYESRDWDKWGGLAKRLESQGWNVTAIGSGNQLDRIAAALNGTSAKILTGAPAAEVTTLLMGAAWVIGNDSGIPHLGGLLNLPTVSVHAGSLPHAFLFSLAPSVRSVTPSGALPRSDHNPAALRSITVDAVLSAITSQP